MNPRPIPPPIRAKIARPASIAMRFTNDDQYWLAVSWYSQTLKNKNPSRPETLLPSYSFGVDGKGMLGIPRASIELRLEKAKQDSQIAKNFTLVYWEIVGKSLADVHRELCSLPGYREQECPTPDDRLIPTSPQRSVIADEDGNQFGLMMNPPFPHGKQDEEGFFGSANYPSLLTALALGSLLFGAVQLLRKSHQ